MMGKRLDEIASRHCPISLDILGAATPWCFECSVGRVVRWPCDAARLLMHIARRESVQEPGTET